MRAVRPVVTMILLAGTVAFTSPQVGCGTYTKIEEAIASWRG